MLWHGKNFRGIINKAKEMIFDNTGTDLISTNAEDAIKEVNSNLSKHELNDNHSVIITGYSSNSNYYTTPSDGYLRLVADYREPNAAIKAYFIGLTTAVLTCWSIGSSSGMASVFVRKGTKIWIKNEITTPSYGEAYFCPLE